MDAAIKHMKQLQFRLNPLRRIARWPKEVSKAASHRLTSGPRKIRRIPSQTYQMLGPRLVGHVRLSLITGLILLIPVALTYLILRFMFDVVDGVLKPWLEWILERFGVDWTVPGPGFALALILIYLAGVFVAFKVGHFKVGHMVVGKVQTTALRVPFVGTIYSATRQLVESFSGSTETGFKRVVLIEFPREHVWSLGFLTDIVTVHGVDRMAMVYVPTAPLPNSGFMALIPFEDVLDTDLSVPVAMQMVFSAGIVSPESIHTRKIDVPTLETEVRHWHQDVQRKEGPNPTPNMGKGGGGGAPLRSP